MKTEAEILKALEVCENAFSKEQCEKECPYYRSPANIDCFIVLIRDAAQQIRAMRGQGTPDQTAKADAGKPRLTLVPPRILYDIAEVREYGCRKYPEGGVDNWKQVDMQRYRDAAFRHFMQYLAKNDQKDNESGLYHLSHLATNISFLCQLEWEARNGKHEG